MNSEIEEVRNELLEWYRGFDSEDEGLDLLARYEALIELRALENIMGLKVGPVE